MLGIIINGIVFLTAILLLFYRREYLLYLYAFLIAFYGIVVDVGVQVTPPTIMSVVMAFDVFNGRTRFPSVVVNYLLFAFGVSFLWSFNLPDIVLNFPPLRGEYRWLMQLLYMLLNYIPVVFIAKHLNNRQQFIKIFNSVFAAAFLLVGLGFLQFSVHSATGVDIFPLNTFRPEYSETAEFAAGKLNIFRVSSIGAGEPKNFAYTCVIILTFLLAKFYFMPKYKLKYGILFFILTFIVFLFTFSTQGYVIIVANMLLVVFFDIFINRRVTLQNILFVCTVATIGLYASTLPIVQLIFEIRVTQRLKGGGVEDFNETINIMLADNPQHILLGTGLGNVHLFAAEYIPPELAFYMVNTVFIAKNGYLRIISDIGLVGFGLFLYMFFKPNLKIYFARQNITNTFDRQIALFIIAVTLILMADYMLTSDGPGYIFLMLGIALAWQKIAIKQHQTS